MTGEKIPRQTCYIHGTTEEEQHRLSILNDLINEASLKELALRGGEHILDVGSGLGQFTRLLARTAGRGANVIGIERDERQRAEAIRLARQEGEQGLVDFRGGDALSFPF